LKGTGPCVGGEKDRDAEGEEKDRDAECCVTLKVIIILKVLNKGRKMI
jgi:hypothetical protein